VIPEIYFINIMWINIKSKFRFMHINCIVHSFDFTNFLVILNYISKLLLVINYSILIKENKIVIQTQKTTIAVQKNLFFCKWVKKVNNLNYSKIILILNKSFCTLKETVLTFKAVFSKYFLLPLSLNTLYKNNS